MRNTIRKVTIVVPVLMTSCQVSENLKSGPVNAQTRISNTGERNVHGEPTPAATAAAILRNSSFIRHAPEEPDPSCDPDVSRRCAAATRTNWPQQGGGWPQMPP